jgi:protein-L-isoaspartate(D-aspartate) O-methyltransferase
MTARLSDSDYAVHRHGMVEQQLRGRGISDHRLLAAMEKVPRHRFVPAGQCECAYDDCPLPIGSEQTISQPYMVARMTELLALHDCARVLEIGTGSGYQTAVLAELAGRVWTIERIQDLADLAKAVLEQQGYTNLVFVSGDGTLGFEQAAPYDAILVAAAAPRVPAALREQLAPGGRMVIPLADGPTQELTLIERVGGAVPAVTPCPLPEAVYRETAVLRCVFVPLIGEQGYGP